METGYLALVLHAHLPFVRHPEHDQALEEDWLFEAITETYIPLLDMFEKLEKDGVDFRLTISLSPTLIEMLNDKFLQGRYLRYLRKLIDLSAREIHRTRTDKSFQELAVMYNTKFSWALRKFVDQYQCDLVSVFGGFMRRRLVEIITCAATHAYLPLIMRNRQAACAQIKVACDHYERIFGRRPNGIWLPELGYAPGLEDLLAREGLKYFFLDAHGIMHAEPRPRYGVFAPVRLENHDISAFGRDLESSAQVWSSRVGYPGDPLYRDFYRDIGFDLDFDYIRPYIQPNGHRKMTGIKYHRITDSSDRKDVYNPGMATERVAMHAEDFMNSRVKQAGRLGSLIDRPPLIMAPYDAELFGHWWYEGPQFLESLFRNMHSCKNTLALTTPSEYLEKYPRNQPVSPAASSWGRTGYSDVWLDRSNDWIYRHLDKAAERMVKLAAGRPHAGGLERRALNQAAKELMLAQSSDWAFIMKSGTMTHYAIKRVKDHLARFNSLYEGIEIGRIDERFLANVESRDNIFKDMDYRVYAEI